MLALMFATALTAHPAKTNVSGLYGFYLKSQPFKATFELRMLSQAGETVVGPGGSGIVRQAVHKTTLKKCTHSALSGQFSGILNDFQQSLRAPGRRPEKNWKRILIFFFFYRF